MNKNMYINHWFQIHYAIINNKKYKSVNTIIIIVIKY